MSYKFIPDSFDYDLVSRNFDNHEKFIECQIMYKMKFERFLSKYLNLGEIQDYISSQNVTIPKLSDEEYNFYHKYSKLDSNYIYIRNNYHVENLEREEIQKIMNEIELNDEFFLQTFKKVMFEKGDKTYFGTPMDETRVDSESIVIEFAFNQIACQTVPQYNAIHQIIDECYKRLREGVKTTLNTECSLIIYNGIPDIFYEEKEVKFK